MFSEQFLEYQFNLDQAIEVIKLVADEGFGHGGHLFARNPSRFELSLGNKISISKELTALTDSDAGQPGKISGAMIKKFLNTHREFETLELDSEYLFRKFGVRIEADGSLNADATVASAGSDFRRELPTVLPLPETQDFASIIRTIRLNDPRFKVIDFAALALTPTEEQLEELKSSLTENIHVGHVKWYVHAQTSPSASALAPISPASSMFSPTTVVPAPSFADAGLAAGGPDLENGPESVLVETEQYKALKAAIEQKIIENNRIIDRYHPSDYTLALLSKHVYQDPETIVTVESTSDDATAIRFTDQSTGGDAAKKEAWQETLSDWKEIATYDHRSTSGYYAVAYANKRIGQIVLAHRGLEFRLLDLLQDESSVKVGIESVFNNNISQAQAISYCATLELVRYAKAAGYSFTTTGHCLGGWYAQLSAYYCYADPAVRYPGVRAVAFDSPGIKPMVDQYRSTIYSAATNLNTDNLDITCYLSVPNVINTCNAHLARDVYTITPDISLAKLATHAGRYIQNYIDTNSEQLAKELHEIYPDLSLADFINKAEIMIQRADSSLPASVASALDLANKLKALKSLMAHSLDVMIDQFDQTTGRPKHDRYKRVTNWPVLKTTSPADTSATDGLISGLADSAAGDAPGGKTASFITGIVVKKALSIAIGNTTAASLANLMSDIMSGRVDIASFVKVYQYFDDRGNNLAFRAGLPPETQFLATYESHLAVEQVNENRQTLLQGKGTTDWYLSQFAQYDYTSWDSLLPLTILQLQHLTGLYRIRDDGGVEGKKFIETGATLSVSQIRTLTRRICDVDHNIAEVTLTRKKVAKQVVQIQKQVIVIDNQPRTLASVPGHIVPNFIGRAEEKAQIQEIISSSNSRKIALITAFGGTGKSTLAAECARNATDAGVVVRWFGEGKVSIGYREIADELGIFTEKQEPQMIRRMVNAKLQNMSDTRFLFVFDNVDKAGYSDIEEYIDELPNNVSLIITSRDRQLPRARGSTLIELQPFNEIEARNYIDGEFRTQTDQEISNRQISLLIDALGTLPLRLSLACATLIDDETMEVEDYIALYESMKRDGKEHPEIDIVLGQLFKKGEKGKAGWKLLQYASYLDPDFIPMMVFKDSEMIDERELSEGTKALKSLSLMTVTTSGEENKGFRMHRFVRDEIKIYTKAVIHSELSIAPEMIILVLSKKLNQLFPEIDSTPDENWKRAKTLASTAERLCEAVEVNKIEVEAYTDNVANIIFKIGSYCLYIECSYKKSLDYYKQSLRLREALCIGQNDQDLAKLMNKVGIAYDVFGDAHKGLEYCERALLMFLELYEGDHPDVANSLNNVGIVYEELGDAHKGLDYKNKALVMRQALYEGNHPAIANSLNNVGTAHQMLGDIGKALEYYERGLAMFQALYEGNHPGVANSLNNVGTAHQVLGNLSKGIDYKENALIMYQALYEGNHPTIADSLNSVGVAYEAFGNVRKGLEYKEKALAMCQALYEGNHSSIAGLLNNVGGSYQTLGNIPKCLEYIKKSLTMYQVLYKANHPVIASLLNNVGVAYKTLGDVRIGLEYQENALAMFQALYEGNHPDVANSLNNVGTAYQELGNVRQAIHYFEIALNMYEVLYNGIHPKIANSLNYVGIAHQVLGDVRKGLEYKEKALEMRQALYEGNHPDVANSLNSVGSAYKALGVAREAIEYYERGLAMFQALYEGNHPDIANSLNNVGTAYQDFGDVRKALEYYERGLAMFQALYEGNHPVVAMSLSNIGIAYETLGDIQKSLNYKEQTLIIYQALYQGNHPDVADSLNNLGVAYAKLGDVRMALEHKVKALEMRQALYEGNHPAVAMSLNNVGVAYEMLGDAHNSLIYKEMALVMRQALYEGNHPDVAMSLNNVGISYEIIGDVQKGLVYKEKALVMRQALYEGNHPDIANSLNSVGIAYEALGNVRKGLEYKEKALIIYQALYNGNHPDVAMLLNNIGIAYRALGDVHKALEYCKKALMMRQELYDGNHPDIAESLNNIGIIYYTSGDTLKSLEYYELTLAMYQTLYTSNHPAIARSLNNIGAAYQKLGKLHQSMEYHKLSLVMREALYNDTPHSDIVFSLNNVGGVCKALGDVYQAIKYFEQALAVERRLNDKNRTVNMTHALKNIAVLYMIIREEPRALYRALKYSYESVLLITGIEQPQYMKSIGEVFIHCLKDFIIQNGFVPNHEVLNQLFAYTNSKIDITNHYPLLQLAFEAVHVGNIENALIYQKLAEYLADNAEISISPEEMTSILHNLGCYYHACATKKGNEGNIDVYLDYISKADASFKRALSFIEEANISNSGLRTDYANFLIVNCRFNEAEEQLKSAIAQQDDNKILSYGNIERDTVDKFIAVKIDALGDISLKASIYAYYLLCKEYIRVGDKPDELELLLREFQNKITIETENGRFNQTHNDLLHQILEINSKTESPALHLSESGSGSGQAQALTSEENSNSIGNSVEQATQDTQTSLLVEPPTISALVQVHLPEYNCFAHSDYNQEQLFKQTRFNFQFALNSIKKIASDRYKRMFVNHYSRELSPAMRLLGRKICIGDALAEPDGSRFLTVSGKRILDFFVTHPDLIEGMSFAEMATRFGVNVTTSVAEINSVRNHNDGVAESKGDDGNSEHEHDRTFSARVTQQNAERRR